MVRNIEKTEFSIADILRKNGRISSSQLSYVLLLAAVEQIKLAKVLYEEGLVSHDDLITLYSQYLNLDIINLHSIDSSINDCYKVEDTSNTTDIHVKNGYFLCKNLNNEYMIIVTDISKLDILSQYCYPIYLSYRSDFYKILESNFKDINSLFARYFLHYMSSNFSSKAVAYKTYILSFFMIFSLVFVFYPSIFYMVNNTMFLIQNIFKGYLLFYANEDDEEIIQIAAQDSRFPYYTILLPVYKELIQLPNLVRNISNLKYPKSRLDIKLIIEEDDAITLKALTSMNIPDYFHIVKVPYSFPRTKPKAMNYAMQYAMGEYVVIYDAEDKPDEDQLLKALDMFTRLPEEYICLQAKLNYYNKHENMLTRLFSFEYRLWFDFLLKGLSVFKLPITLGGTSNHFKAKYLKQIGGWDSYNVTEDAELGIRIYLNNYKTAILNSYTLEEAPISIKNWMYQRSRWIKGYIQTFIVYLRNAEDAFELLDCFSFVSVFIFVGLVTYSFLILPWIYIIFYFFKFNDLSYLLSANLYMAIIYMYLAIYYVHKKEKIGLKDIVTVIIWPLYFLLHTIASYRALYDLIFTPFKWNKTTHGVSNMVHHDISD